MKSSMTGRRLLPILSLRLPAGGLRRPRPQRLRIGSARSPGSVGLPRVVLRLLRLTAQLFD